MKTLEIILGLAWKQFAFVRDDLEYLGTIRRGIEIGALAKDANGNFLQINGDMRQPLNKSRIEAHLRELEAKLALSHRFHQPTLTERSAVIIVVKPRRRFIEPIA